MDWAGRSKAREARKEVEAEAVDFSDWEEVVVKEEADFSVSKSERDRPCMNDSLMRTMMT